MTPNALRRAARLLLGAALCSGIGACGSQAPEATSGSAAGAPSATSGAAGGAGSAEGGQAGTGVGGTGGSDLAAAGGGEPAAGGAAGSGTVGGAGPTGGATGEATGGSGSDAAGGATAGAGGKAGGAAGGSAGGAAGAGGALPNITVWIAGDSTVATTSSCPIGWGGQFKALFNSQVSVTNSAVGGRSVHTWMYDVLTTKDSAGECDLGKDAAGAPTVQARWTTMKDGMKAGDYLFIQFGINDGDSACPRHVGASAFKTTYGMMAQAAKDKGAHPVFVTPVSQIACSGSKVSTGTREPYVTATKEAGAQYSVPVINLNHLSTTLYQSLGFCPIPGGGDVSATTGGAVGKFFCDDHTHFDTAGAAQIASLVAGALSASGIGLAAYLK